MEMMKVYHDFYLKCEVLLFQKFKNNNLTNYGFFSNSASGLSWNAMHKMMIIELELIPDPDMYILFEIGKSDGISYISNGYSKILFKIL